MSRNNKNLTSCHGGAFKSPPTYSKGEVDDLGAASQKSGFKSCTGESISSILCGDRGLVKNE